MSRKLLLHVCMILLLPLFAAYAQQQPVQKKPLDIYFMDTEGGQATLFVSPSGQSMLVDTGFPGNQGAATPAEAAATNITRDADRIMAVLKLANVNVLDYVVLTHFHADHAGNAAELAHRIPDSPLHRSRALHGGNAGGTRCGHPFVPAGSRARACHDRKTRRPYSCGRTGRAAWFHPRAK